MADISDEAVQAAWSRLDRVTHTLTEDDVRDMLAAALANLLERIHDLEEAFESASKCADMAVTRVRELEDALLGVLENDNANGDGWMQARAAAHRALYR